MAPKHFVITNCKKKKKSKRVSLIEMGNILGVAG